jgi:hypothetical protein
LGQDDRWKKCIGRPVRIEGFGAGTMRYYGTPHFKKEGRWIGIELDEPNVRNSSAAFSLAVGSLLSREFAHAPSQQCFRKGSVYDH